MFHRVTTRVKRHTAPRRDKHLAIEPYISEDNSLASIARRVTAFFISNAKYDECADDSRVIPQRISFYRNTFFIHEHGENL